MQTTVSLLTTRHVIDLQEQIVAIYRRAFGGPPYNKGEVDFMDFAQSLPKHAERQGFRFVAARDGNGQSLLGFAYGYLSRPGLWWYEQVVEKTSKEVVDEWLARSFRLVEMAVDPAVWGQGLGGVLHDQLLDGLEYLKAVLSTMEGETAAYRLYSGRGWKVLADQFYFEGVERSYRIMGLDLSEMRPDLHS